MIDLRSPPTKQSLAELRDSGHALMRTLSQAERDMFLEQQGRASKRADWRILALISEFINAFRDPPPSMHYEHAFASEWIKTNPQLYNCRHWICSYNAGVYFIFDSSESLRYVGSSCGGDLGFRLYEKHHDIYRCLVDVVLFDEQLPHYALAFEALVISRLKPPENTSFKSLWIPPPPPFDRVWKSP